MVKIINTIDAYHSSHVRDAIEELQRQGFNVVRTERVQRMKFIVFGEDVTYIYYTRCF